jgi:hypothetical protein
MQLQERPERLPIGLTKRWQFAFSDFLYHCFLCVGQPDALNVQERKINPIES